MDLADVKEFLTQFEDTVVVNVLEDNKYEVGTYTMLGEDLLHDMVTKKVKVDGIGSREFYIVRNQTDYTIQVSNFELDTHCDF